jgi:hypothetical protein
LHGFRRQAARDWAAAPARGILLAAMRPPQLADDNLVIDVSDGFINPRNGPFARDFVHDISSISLFRTGLSVARQERVRERGF